MKYSAVRNCASLLATLVLGGGLLVAAGAEQKVSEKDCARLMVPSPRLLQLVANLPSVGRITDFSKLGLSLTVTDKLPITPSQNATSYNFLFPKDLDRKSTDEGALKGKYPGIHLNLPLQVQKSYINYLFISDQPERIKDDRKRYLNGQDVDPGAIGIYARSPIPTKSTSRVLVDHTNGTSRPLKFSLVWVGQDEGHVTVRKRSQSVHKDSVAAGSNSFAAAGQMTAEPRIAVAPGQGVVLAETMLKPEDTVVLQMEMFSIGQGQLAAVVTEPDAPVPLSVAALDQTPILHSIMWHEEEDRLGKFIDPKADPTRFKRIKNAYQHARGHFQFPDRLATTSYRLSSWDEKESPVQIFSLFESIPGVDVTVKKGVQPTTTDNRGKYGARVGLKLEFDKLPADCKEVALLAINRGDVYGGRHWVSDGRRRAFETYLRPGTAPGVLRKGQACNLWQGPLKSGESLTMWTEPMANTSVHLLYLLVPVPAATAK